MERWLDKAFIACGVMAAVFLVGICVLVLAQIIGRLFGVAIPSADEFAGYCLSASTFLALSYALRQGSHIRVTLLIDRLPPKGRRMFEAVCVTGGLALSAYLTWFTIEMVWFSIEFGDVTQGLVPIPLWIPQMGMVIGLTMLTLAFAVDASRLLRGLNPVYLPAAAGAAKPTKATATGEH
ncbi:MAG: TRAP transporter small permease [Burkholderiaceae bacterium]